MLMDPNHSQQHPVTSLINALQAAFWLEQEIGNQAQGKI